MVNTYILLYHALDSPVQPVAVRDAADLGIVVKSDQFGQQLQCLSGLGMRVVSLETVLSPESGSPGEEDCVVLTFDDGHRSNWALAVPELVAAGATGTFYVVAGYVDKKPDYLTSAQLREMAAHGMLIGSHGMTHRWLPELTAAELRGELADSKAQLEDVLQRPVRDLALPGGHFNRGVIEAAHECGYRSVATCRVGTHRTGDDPFRLPRLEIRRDLSLEGFRSTFCRGKIWQLQALEAAKACLRRACGLSRYTRLRQLAHRYLTLNR